MSGLLSGMLIIAIGFLVFWNAKAFANVFSFQASQWEKDGVVRQAGFPATKIWRDDAPEKFAGRVRLWRALAVYTFWFTRIWGGLFAFGGIVATISGLLK